MSDKYPRVLYSDIDGQWFANDDGRFKVVPADAIVIERGEVGAASLGLITYSLTAEKARELAVRYLALAEYLRANPPVDRAQVDALAQIIAAVRKGQDVTPNDLADRILRHGGVRVEVTL